MAFRPAVPYRTPILATAFLLAAAARVLPAQAAAPLEPKAEFHAAAVLSPRANPMVGLGVNVRAGWYSRVGLAALVGAAGSGGDWQLRQRLEGTARFLFDPYAQADHGFYAGAGLGVERAEGGQMQALLLAVVGVEGKAEGRVVPAIELTVGGGARLGIVLRGRRGQGR